MNILITTPTYYPSVEGVSIVTQYQAEGLVRLGHKVTVITGGRKGINNEETHNNIKIVRIKAYDDLMLHFGNKKQYRKIVIELSKEMDIMMNVYLESWSVDWLLSILDNISCRKIMMIHGIADMSWNQFHDFSLYGMARKIWGDIRWRCFFPFHWKNIKKYDAIAQLHEEDYANRFFMKHGITKCQILYNAVDERFFQWDIPKKNRIINVGTYCKRKNQIYCMELFYQSDAKDYELILIGSRKNKYCEKLIKKKEELEKKYGVRKVQILYGQSRKDTIQCIIQSKIYLLTSITEMFPVSLIEGMAAGCAFVSTDVGINKYLPGGIIGHSRKELRHALNEMLNEEVCKTYAETGRLFAIQNCRQEEQVKRLESILYHCLNKEVY